jgi:hypothetical protein
VLQEYCHGRTANSNDLKNDNEVSIDQTFDGDTLRVNWCRACVDATTETVDNTGIAWMWRANINAMGMFDWATAFIVGSLMGLSITGEDKDVFLCLLTLEHKRENVGTGWRVAITVLCGVRRWVFLPSLLVDVTMLVITRGGDALNLALK